MAKLKRIGKNRRFQFNSPAVVALPVRGAALAAVVNGRADFVTELLAVAVVVVVLFATVEVTPA